jgi:dTDP-4-dehydrorhamnose reductase
MKLLITGANGLLGHKLTEALNDPKNPFASQFQFLATSRTSLGEYRHAFERMDITDTARISQVFESFKPDVVIHTAAMTQVDLCENDPENCRAINVTGTRNILTACERTKTHLIHLSSDFVFDGKSGPYREEDPPSPLSVYGKTKLVSEELVSKSAIPWTIIRTILVYGYSAPLKSRSNLILWVINSLNEGRTINVVTDHYRMPTLAEDLAWACLQAALRKKTGLYHVSGKDMMSIYEAARKVAVYFDLDITKILPIDSSVLKEAARRPGRTGFYLDKAAKELDYSPRSFEEGLGVVKKMLKDGESV